jgi:hypothetical protein
MTPRRCALRAAVDAVLRYLRSVAWIALALLPSAAAAAEPQPEHHRDATFFVGRLQFATNSGGDCGDVGLDLVKLLTRVSTLAVQEERPLKLADEGLFETPFLFMNGHDDFQLSDAELENLRLYVTHGGFVFASGCCTNPAFPAAWRRELSRLFPGEQVRELPYDHLIYRSFYRLERIRSNNGNRDIHLEGLLHDGDLVAVMGEDGLCCAFAMDGVCNRGEGVDPEEARKVAVNVAVYALTH